MPSSIDVRIRSRESPAEPARAFMVAVWEAIRRSVLEKGGDFRQRRRRVVEEDSFDQLPGNSDVRCDLPNHNSRNHPAWRFKAKCNVDWCRARGNRFTIGQGARSRHHGPATPWIGGISVKVSEGVPMR